MVSVRDDDRSEDGHDQRQTEDDDEDNGRSRKNVPVLNYYLKNYLNCYGC